MNNFDEMRASGLAKYFYQLAEQSQDVFWIRSRDYSEQIYISPAFEQSWGITCEALYADPSLWMNAVYPADREHIPSDCTMRKPPKIGETFVKNYRIVRSDKSIRYIRDVSFGLFDENNECFGLAGICQDVSKDVLHSQELEEAIQNAEMANQAKADFLAKMSHEFRTPLNAILGLTQIMKKKGLTPEYEEYITLISQAGNTLLSFVNDILDFAKVEVGELSISNEPLDLHLLVSQVIHSFRYQSDEKNINLSLNYVEGTPKFVMGDAKRIRQIFVNLINNALKFTEKGSILVDVDYTTNENNQRLFHINVKDTGIGIDKSKHSFIFEKFSQIAPVHETTNQGTGLGLAITKQLVERIGGTISLESEPGVGSVFSFTLPLTLQDDSLAKSANSANTHSVSEIPNESLDLNILLVEDHLINQRIVKLMLEGIGCRLTIANDGFEAIKLIDENPVFDVVLMDIGLPKMNGFEVTTEIRVRKNYQDVPIIAMTAHALECDLRQCYDSGMNNIIIKPIRYEDLFNLLKQVSLKISHHKQAANA